MKMLDPIKFQLILNNQVADIQFQETSVQCGYMDIVWAIEDVLEKLGRCTDVRLVHMSSYCENFVPDGVQNELVNISKIGSVSRLLSSVDLPIVVSVKKNAVGMGLEMVLCADVKICSQDSRFSMNQVGNGLIPFEGGTQRLSRSVGLGRALELIMTGRMFYAQEALEIGLVQYVSEKNVSIDTFTVSLLETICNAGPIATKYLKEAVRNGHDMTLRDGLTLETDLNVILQSTSDRAEGIASFMERRSPEFTNE
tara:strand:- start:217 stop:978 length:762 start_codon:yes stop_codon:yes gene_type:complete